jgi:hypothetical protein
MGQAPSTSPNAPDLRSLRVEYRKNLLSSLLEENYKYRDDLRVVERKLAASADYTGALRARNERRQIEQEVTAMEQEIPALNAQLLSLRHASLPDRIVFLPKDAKLTGVSVELPTNGISGWRPSRSLAVWELSDLPPGGYEVYISSSSSAKGSANFVLRENRYTLDCQVKDITEKPTEKLYGTLRVSDGKSSLILTAERVDENQFVRIHSVTLVPANR